MWQERVRFTLSRTTKRIQISPLHYVVSIGFVSLWIKPNHIPHAISCFPSYHQFLCCEVGRPPRLCLKRWTTSVRKRSHSWGKSMTRECNFCVNWRMECDAFFCRIKDTMHVADDHSFGIMVRPDPYGKDSDVCTCQDFWLSSCWHTDRQKQTDSR